MSHRVLKDVEAARGQRRQLGVQLGIVHREHGQLRLGLGQERDALGILVDQRGLRAAGGGKLCRADAHDPRADAQAWSARPWTFTAFTPRFETPARMAKLMPSSSAWSGMVLATSL